MPTNLGDVAMRVARRFINRECKPDDLASEMTKREAFAIMALQAQLPSTANFPHAAVCAVEAADALIVVLNRVTQDDVIDKQE